MEMTEEFFNRMTDEEKEDYLNKLDKLSDAIDSLGAAAKKTANQIQASFDCLEAATSGKKRKAGTGIRSKAPRNIASRKPVKR